MATQWVRIAIRVGALCAALAVFAFAGTAEARRKLPADYDTRKLTCSDLVDGFDYTFQSEADLKLFKSWPDAAKQGDAEAMARLGELNAGGGVLTVKSGSGSESTTNVEVSNQHALEFFHSSAERDHSYAQMRLAMIYQEGIGTDRDLKKAAAWFEKSAGHGNCIAQFKLGQLLLSPPSPQVSKNPTRALELLLAAAKQGHPIAMYDVASLYANGDEGIPKNPAESLKWDIKGAEAGYAPSQANLGFKMAMGMDTPKNEAEGYAWSLKAAQQGYADAQFDVFMAHLVGRGVPKNPQEGSPWLAKAAEGGSKHASYYLAKGYKDGILGFDKNKDEAIKWMHKSAERGYSEAQFELGVMYLNGDLVKQSYQECAVWMAKVAEQGNPQAQYILAQLMLRGLGVPRDPVEGYKWLLISAETSNAKEPRELVQTEGGKLTPEQLEQAKKRAAEFRRR